MFEESLIPKAPSFFKSSCLKEKIKPDFKQYIVKLTTSVVK